MTIQNFWLGTLSLSALKPSCVRSGTLGAWQRDKLQTSQNRRHVSSLIPLHCTFWVCFVSSEPTETPSGVRLQRGSREVLPGKPTCVSTAAPPLHCNLVGGFFTLGNIWDLFSKERKEGSEGKHFCSHKFKAWCSDQIVYEFQTLFNFDHVFTLINYSGR